MTLDLPETIRIQVISTPDLIKALAAEATEHPESITVGPSTVVADPSSLQLDLTTLESVVAIVKVGFLVAELAPKLRGWLSASERQSQKVVFQTSRRTIIGTYSKEVTEDEIRNDFLRLLGGNRR